MNNALEKPRYDALAKVTGRADYAADRPVEGLVHGVTSTSVIARGRLESIDTAVARTMPGVLAVFTHLNAPPRASVAHFAKGGPITNSTVPLASDRINHDGEIIALVVAETREEAVDAVAKIRVTYLPEAATASMESAGAEYLAAADAVPGFRDKAAGAGASPEGTCAQVIDAEYRTPTQHHAMMELYSTTAVWQGNALTIYEPTQYLWGLKNGVAAQLLIPPENVTVINPYVGGAFGAYCGMSQCTALAAAVARQIGRPVRVALDRYQMFTLLPYRAETKHAVRLDADADGKLRGYTHRSWEASARVDDFFTAGMENTVEIYAADHIETKAHLVRTDRSSPGWMRAPGDFAYMFALESAMDELAFECGVDPVELRRRNDTMTSPMTGAPYTSRSLVRCFDEAAARFEWTRRSPVPGSVRDGDWLVGMGCASASYAAVTRSSAVRVILTDAGEAIVQVAAHELGQGSYTALSILAAEALQWPLEATRVELGTSSLPPSIVAGGAWTTASVGCAINEAAMRLRSRPGYGSGQRDAMVALRSQGVPSVEEYVEWTPQGERFHDEMRGLFAGKLMVATGGPTPEPRSPPAPITRSFGAQFVEVGVHVRTREIRVRRLVGAFAAGRIVSERATRSQYSGGMIWGVGSALLEATEIDPFRARYLNDNLAEYLVAVNADIPEVDIIIVPEIDNEVNPLGVKPVGELANVGTAAAVANAVFNATGRRIRSLPIRLDDLLQ